MATLQYIPRPIARHAWHGTTKTSSKSSIHIEAWCATLLAMTTVGGITRTRTVYTTSLWKGLLSPLLALMHLGQWMFMKTGWSFGEEEEWRAEFSPIGRCTRPSAAASQALNLGIQTWNECIGWWLTMNWPCHPMNGHCRKHSQGSSCSSGWVWMVYTLYCNPTKQFAIGICLQTRNSIGALLLLYIDATEKYNANWNYSCGVWNSEGTGKFTPKYSDFPVTHIRLPADMFSYKWAKTVILHRLMHISG